MDVVDQVVNHIRPARRPRGRSPNTHAHTGDIKATTRTVELLMGVRRTVTPSQGAGPRRCRPALDSDDSRIVTQHGSRLAKHAREYRAFATDLARLRTWMTRKSRPPARPGRPRDRPPATVHPFGA